MFSHALTFNGEVSRMRFIVIDDFYGQTHLSLQVSLNVRDFVWVLFHFFFFNRSCVPVMMVLIQLYVQLIFGLG